MAGFSGQPTGCGKNAGIVGMNSREELKSYISLCYWINKDAITNSSTATRPS
jgi:hypothetical protein